jgi:hypothetical protein
MPREPKPEWVAALKALCGAESDLRFNETAGRWEFVLPSADGISRSQFWGWFYQPRGQERLPLEPDPETGLHAFRDLDDATMREALANLERTFIGNRHDGAGTTRREVERRMAFNADLLRGKYRRAGEAFADLVHERARRLRGAPLVQILLPTGGKP